MKLSDFDFTLPEESIAATPAQPRDAARLLYVVQGAWQDRQVRDLSQLLRRGDLLVCNNTKVLPARLFGRRGEAQIEVMLHKQVRPGGWECFARPAKRLRIGDHYSVSDDFSAEVIGKLENGLVLLQFNQQGDAFFAALHRYGAMPLPPYIKRPAEAKDQENYQTIFAKRQGAVAAPTAGLHFTPELLAALQEKQVGIAYVTLHVGGGTFLPVKTENIHEHVMHSEWCEIDQNVAEQIQQTKQKGGRVIAVGTTSLRVLESAARADGVIRPFTGDTDIFITPGYHFNSVDMLMTNFHLPRSTLFMLVCAFAGMETMHAAYQHAIQAGYRFYSYGDACLLERQS